MTLTQPISPLLFDDPAIAYASLTAGLQQGEKWVQAFDYSIKEQPTVVGSRPLEEIFPNSPVLSADRDLDSWEPSQGGFAICGSVASVCCFASVPTNLPIALENAIYPQERSPHGIYLVRMADPAKVQAFKWVAIDSVMPTKSNGNLQFSWTVDGEPLAKTLLLKAMATVRGGSFDEISNSAQFNIGFPGWFPYVEKNTNSFTEFKQAMQQGCLASFTFAQQYDALGQKVTPSGVIYGHAYGAVNFIETPGYQLVRVENPHGMTARDLATEYGDDSSFWAEHPEFAREKFEASQGGGNWWMNWSQLVSMCSGGTIRLRTWTGAGI